MCIFQEKGSMNEKKAQHKAYKPKEQDFYVIFGGENPLSFYKSNLEIETSDSLLNLKQMFMDLLNHLNHNDLKPYLIVAKKFSWLIFHLIFIQFFTLFFLSKDKN